MLSKYNKQNIGLRNEMEKKLARQTVTKKAILSNVIKKQ